jgi:hypothetical protein
MLTSQVGAMQGVPRGRLEVGGPVEGSWDPEGLGAAGLVPPISHSPLWGPSRGLTPFHLSGTGAIALPGNMLATA